MKRNCRFIYRADKRNLSCAASVTFTLREHLSVAEKRDARVVDKVQTKKQTQTTQGSATAKEAPEKLSWFESKVLKPINDKIGPAK